MSKKDKPQPRPMLEGVRDEDWNTRVRVMLKAGTEKTLAEHMAAREMLDEVHLMLRFLVERKLRR